MAMIICGVGGAHNRTTHLIRVLWMEFQNTCMVCKGHDHVLGTSNSMMYNSHCCIEPEIVSLRLATTNNKECQF